MDHMAEVREKFEAEYTKGMSKHEATACTERGSSGYYKLMQATQAYMWYSSGYVDGYKDGTDDERG